MQTGVPAQIIYGVLQLHRGHAVGDLVVDAPRRRQRAVLPDAAALDTKTLGSFVSTINSCNLLNISFSSLRSTVVAVSVFLTTYSI